MSTVIVSPYSVEWPKLFGELREELLAVFAPMEVAIEHIGSTSVPQLAAKPVIDVLLGANCLDDVELKINALSDFGYLYVPKYESELPMRRYFVKSAVAALRVHLHAVERGSRLWKEHLAFRDVLRADSRLRSQYQSLKLQLATEYANDKSAYSAAKNPFIQSVLAAVAGRDDVA
jgi:GrpB-like predicted nucleotidyltransferase (UPF0157 family)